MRTESHLRLITRTPIVAQSNLQVLLTGVTAIIERLLQAQRQAAWKAYPTEGEDPPDTGGGGGDGNGGGGFGEL